MQLIIDNICLFLVEVLKLSLIMLGVLNYKSKKGFIFLIKEVVVSMIIISFLTILNSYQNGSSYQYLYYFIIFLVMFNVICAITGKAKVLITFIVYMGISLIDVILIGSLQIIFDLNIIEFKQNVKDNLINLFSVLLFLLIVVLKKRINKDVSKLFIHFKKRYLFIMLMGIIGFGLYIAPIQILVITDEITSNRNMFTFGVYASGIAFIVICIVLVIINDSNIYYKNINEMNLKLFDQQKLYYQTLIDKEQYTKRFRHDINNHIYCMQHLCEQKKFSELAEYLKDMHNFTVDLNFDIQTGNDIVNIIVNDIYARNKDSNISIKWKGFIPENIRISPMDLCTIFSNLLINAIEAVKKISDKNLNVINIEIKSLSNNLLIQISNPVSEKVNIINNRLITTKSNKEQHGFGSMNVEHSVKKYKGDLTYNSDDNNFMVSLVFQNIII